MQTITILGIPVHNITYQTVFDKIREMIATGKPHQIVTVNPEFLVIAHQDHEFAKVLKSADLALDDGVGLQLAALFQGKKFKTRIPGSDLVYLLAPLAEKEGWRLFFLGAKPGVAGLAAASLKKKYPAIRIAASSADPTSEGTVRAIEQIREFQPHILLVAYGAPKQDVWIHAHKKDLAVPVMIGVGGTLDFIAGIASRSPRILHKFGLEWLYRLVKEPWRWRRQLRLPVFLGLVLSDSLQKFFHKVF